MYVTLELYSNNNFSASSLFSLFISCTSMLLILSIFSIVSCAKTMSPTLIVPNNPTHINDNFIISFFTYLAGKNFYFPVSFTIPEKNIDEIAILYYY